MSNAKKVSLIMLLPLIHLMTNEEDPIPFIVHTTDHKLALTLINTGAS